MLMSKLWHTHFHEIPVTHFLAERQKTSVALVADLISSDDSLQLNMATLFPCEPKVTHKNTTLESSVILGIVISK